MSYKNTPFIFVLSCVTLLFDPFTLLSVEGTKNYLSVIIRAESLKNKFDNAKISNSNCPRKAIGLFRRCVYTTCSVSYSCLDSNT